MEKSKLIEILNSYLKEDKTGRYYYIQDIDFKNIASDTLAFHNAEIAKYKELVEALKELILRLQKQMKYAGFTTPENMADELRCKIVELESEVGK